MFDCFFSNNLLPELGISVLHRVNIHQALGLGARLLDNLLGPVYRTQAGHPLPVFTGTRAYRLVIAGHSCERGLSGHGRSPWCGSNNRLHRWRDCNGFEI